MKKIMKKIMKKLVAVVGMVLIMVSVPAFAKNGDMYYNEQLGI